MQKKKKEKKIIQDPRQGKLFIGEIKKEIK